jgi:DNA repair ATPase RecN
MENIHTVIAPADLEVAIAEARQQVVDSERGGYGSKRRYAFLLNQKFEFNWFEVKHTDITDEGKAVRKEKEVFFNELKKIEHVNPSKIWKDVRNYGREERFPEEKKLDAEGNEVTEVEEGKSGANHNRSPMLRNVEELTALWKFNKRQESIPDNLQKATVKIGEALQALGVNLSMIQ